MNYETYATKEQAQAEVEKMQGWSNPQPEQMHLPDNPLADADGNVWVISVSNSTADRLYQRMSTRHKLEFVYQMAKYSSASIGTCQRLMRYGATWVRLETELTNGYKKQNGEWDTLATKRAKDKRDRIGEKMEALAIENGCGIDYGALTVRVVFQNGREAGIP